MRTIYRISDNSYHKIKLASKKQCLVNYLNVFPDVPLTIILDNCRSETIDMVKSLATAEFIETNLGNAGSFCKALDIAMDYADEEIFYILEDDYIHKNGCCNFLEEGLQFGDYATLFDYIDKYYNPEITKVFRGRNIHWRWSISTTMTFATKVKTLKQDIEIWKFHCKGQHPNDHFSFCELKERGRNLCVAIPGYATHVDMTPYRDISFPDMWAIDMLNNL